MSMDKQKKLIYKIVLAILFVLLLFLLIKLYPMYQSILVFTGKILLPFIIAAFISYLLYPITLKLHELNLNKAIAVIVIYFIFFLIVTIAIYKAFPVFVRQLQDLSEQLPQLIIIYEDFIYSIYDSTSFLPEVVHDKIAEFIIRIETSIENQITHILNKLSNIFDFIIILTIIPVLVFYFLKDFSEIKQWFKKWMTNRNFQRAEEILSAIDISLGKYIRGQLIISLSIMFVTLVIYYILQIKYALLLAAFLGIMNIIPYFGPIIGTIPALAIAVTMSWKTVLFVLITSVVVQVLESSFLSPYIMGKSVQIHPIVIILTLLIGAELGGIIGMIIAIPTVTICKAIFSKILEMKQQCN